MNGKLQYQRLFFIFEKGEERKNYSGYIRLMQNGNITRLNVNVSNISDIPEDKKVYHDLIIIFYDKNRDSEFPLYIPFKLKVNGGIVSQEIVIDSFNIENTGLGIDNIWGFVICETLEDSSGFLRHSFPLISIKDEKRPWRNLLLNKIKQRSKPQPMPKYEEKMNSKVEKKQHKAESKQETLPRSKSMPLLNEVPYSSTDTSNEPKSEPKSEPSTLQKILHKHEYEVEPEDEIDKEIEIDHVLKYKGSENEQQTEQIPNQEKHDGEFKNDEGMTNSDNRDSDDEYFSKHFEQYDPFGTTNNAYRWWKCTDVHKLNDMLLKINIWLPLELNKECYIACEKYEHIVVGLYFDRRTKRKFVIIGVPAESTQDQGNYHNNSLWETTDEGYEPAGFWLTFIDMETSNVVKAT